MSYVNREWEKKPAVTAELLNAAHEWGMYIMHVCVEPLKEDGEQPLSFVTISGSVPTAGDIIETQNGKLATVLTTVHRVTRLDNRVFMLVPNIHARLNDSTS